MSGQDGKSRREVWAAALAVVIGIPLMVMLGTSIADGFVRAGQAPLRAVLGNERYEALEAGEGGVPHYLGHERLAPDFTLRDRDGNEWRLADHRGEVVVLNFWSVTCQPCIEEMPTLELLSEMSKRRWNDVNVLAVSADSSWAEVQPVLDRIDAMEGIVPRLFDPDRDLLHLLDPGKAVVEGAFGTRLYPETWIIDREGVIRFRYDGGRDWSTALMLDVIELFR